MSQGTRRGAFFSYGLPFLALFVALYALYQWLEPFLIHYYAALASSICLVLSPFDPAVGCQSNVILYQGVESLQVVEGCDGVAFVVLMLSAVLPFPRPWRERLIGLLILIPALLLFNWLRLLALALIRFYAPDYFHLFHIYLFQPVMIFLTVGVFILWLLYESPGGNPPLAET